MNKISCKLHEETEEEKSSLSFLLSPTSFVIIVAMTVLYLNIRICRIQYTREVTTVFTM